MLNPAPCHSGTYRKQSGGGIKEPSPVLEGLARRYLTEIRDARMPTGGIDLYTFTPMPSYVVDCRGSEIDFRGQESAFRGVSVL